MGYDQKAASSHLKSHILSMPKPYIFLIFRMLFPNK